MRRSPAVSIGGGTHLPDEMPEALTIAFYADAARQEQWQAYGQQGGLFNAPPDDFQENRQPGAVLFGTCVCQHPGGRTLWPALARGRTLAGAIQTLPRLQAFRRRSARRHSDALGCTAIKVSRDVNDETLPREYRPRFGNRLRRYRERRFR